VSLSCLEFVSTLHSLWCMTPTHVVIF